MTQSRLRYNNRSYHRSQSESFRPYLYSIAGIIIFTFAGFGIQNVAMTINNFGSKAVINKSNICEEWSRGFSLTNPDNCSDASATYQFGNYLDAEPASMEHNVQRSTN